VIIKSIPKPHLLLWTALGLVLPAFVLRRVIGLPARGDRQEATLLFTSGSAGEPKGVPLSHRNLLANVAQIEGALDRSVIDSMLGCLPTFHSFGATVTLWWPLLGGPAVVTYPSPLETAKLAELIQKYDIALLLNTPTFLRAFLRKARPEQLASLKMVVTGAEKTPLDLHEKFASHFSAPLCEGYGMTEATPVVAVNRLDLYPPTPGRLRPTYRQLGSVGPLLPGLSARIRDPETGQNLPLGESGLLWLKGANIFEGYLNDPTRTAQVLKDGWYCTGDFGHLDANGFLFIDGRLARFSKIAGEMVPHGVLEQKLNEAYNLTEVDVPQLAVMGVPDTDKGEALVLLSVSPLDLTDVRSKLLAVGISPLWIPKRIKQVPTIPVTSTGKMDLQACRNLALEVT
jgi:acyl-[acyl-carrier-protein]-phospholipid O-acyltransferase/long-chain-fatty-acid--[acyl-carrier-protein] ligase